MAGAARTMRVVAAPRKPLIDPNETVRIALEMIDADGLAAFSIEKLGKRLGVRGPSLYHHFADRADLLRHVAQLILLEVPDAWAEDEDLPWDEGFLRMTLALRRAMLHHPNAAPLLLEHYPRALVLDSYERAGVTLQEAGVPERYHLMLMEGTEKLALGFALYRGVALADIRDGDYPALSRAVESSADDDEAVFEAAVVAFLEGIKARATR